MFIHTLQQTLMEPFTNGSFDIEVCHTKTVKTRYGVWSRLRHEFILSCC